jgi:hypothetical protein
MRFSPAKIRQSQFFFTTTENISPSIAMTWDSSFCNFGLVDMLTQMIFVAHEALRRRISSSISRVVLRIPQSVSA